MARQGKQQVGKDGQRLAPFHHAVDGLKRRQKDFPFNCEFHKRFDLFVALKEPVRCGKRYKNLLIQLVIKKPTAPRGCGKREYFWG
jgi:hypothetical protein